MLSIDRIWQDLRHGFRVFVTAPGFAAIAVVSIAFGTGANVAMFSVVDALLLRPPPVSRPNELITVGSRVNSGVGNVGRLRMSSADYRDLRERSHTFGGLLAFTPRWVGFAAHPRTPARIKIATLVSANFFQVLGIEPSLGRAFLPDEDRVPGRDAVAILSHDIWQQEFSRDAGVIGRMVRIAGMDFTVVGVAPEGFTGLDPFTRDAVYLPLAMFTRVMNSALVNPLDDRGARLLTVKGRLAPGALLSAARAEVAAIGADLERAYPATNRNQPLVTQTELQMRFERRPLDSRALILLTILSGAVLCVACANVAGLLASRAPARAREFAVRLAIGASRGRIITQLVTESVSIAVAGGLGGIAVGYAGIVMFRRIDFASDVFAYPNFQLDQRTLTFSLIAAIASVLLFGVWPAIQTARVDLAQAMKAADMGRARRRPLRGRSVLVAAQVAVSLVVLTIAAFVFQMFTREFMAGPGFRVSHIALATLDAAQARYTGDESIRFFERVVDEARRLPAVLSATVTSEMPLWGLELRAMVPEGYQLAGGQSSVRLFSSSIDESYFDTLDIPILSGRAVQATDTADAPRVAVVNEALARRYWPGEDAVGRRFRLDGDHGPWVEVVGVARNATYIYTGEPPFEVAYFPFRQASHGSMMLLVRTSGDSAALLDPLSQMVRRMDEDVPVFNVQTIEHFYDARATSVNSIVVSMIGALGLMGMTLTMIGLYGLVSYAVSRRTREIGVRIAVGASPGRVLAMVLREGMVPAWSGLGVGLVLSAIVAKLLPALVPIAPTYDGRAVLAVVPMLIAVTLIAASIPARRAARVDPTVALRAE